MTLTAMLDWCLIVIDHVFIFFQPGSAGNFFGRCLNLLSDSVHNLVSSQQPQLITDLDEKFQLLSYHQPDRDWVQFESRLPHYSDITPELVLPDNSISVRQDHPRYEMLEKGIAGEGDRRHVFYIDPSQRFEWCLLNALYKNSYINTFWLEQGARMLEDNAIHKISLPNIIDSADTLLIEISKVAAVLGLEVKPANQQRIVALWNQWIPTTLQPKDFEQFKQKIGFTY
jgi:hypothetical protein